MNPTDTLPPNNPNAERAIIGCALQEPTMAAELRTDWFYDLRYRTIAEAVIQMAAEGRRIGPDTVAQELVGTGLKDAALLVNECLDSCHSPANWPYWRDELAEALTYRRVLQTCLGTVEAVNRGDGKVGDILDAFERDALAIRQQAQGGGTGEIDIKATLHELTRDYETAHTQGRAMGIPSGFTDLDKLLGGFMPQQLVIIAARPSVGKTALALGIAERVALEYRIPVGFFSLEMSGKELVHRLTCSRAHVDGTVFRDGRATERDIQRLTVAQGAITKAPLHINDRGGLSLAQLMAQARRWVQRHAIKLLIVDYLGLVRSGEKGRGRYEDQTTVSNGLKFIAKELDMPVIALAQLNRESERDDRPPRLSDLRDTGAIEQDADVAMLLHRNPDVAIDGHPVVNVIVAKQRNGAVGMVKLIFRREYTRFENAA